MVRGLQHCILNNVDCAHDHVNLVFTISLSWHFGVAAVVLARLGVEPPHVQEQNRLSQAVEGPLVEGQFLVLEVDPPTTISKQK